MRKESKVKHMRTGKVIFAVSIIWSTLSVAAANVNLTWQGPASGGDISDGSNWKGGSISADNTLALGKSGTFTMSADISANRFVTWADNLTWTLDFSGHTLTAVGGMACAFGQTKNNWTATLTGGKILIPTGKTYAYLGLPSEAKTADRHNGCLTITGASTSIETPNVMVNWGSNEWIKVANGAVLKTSSLSLGSDAVAQSTDSGEISCWPDNGIQVDNATLQCTAAVAATLKIGGKYSLRNRFELKNNGVLSNFSNISFAGTNSVFSVDNATFTTAGSSATTIGGSGSLVEVKNGGSLIFGNGSDVTKNAGRFWLRSDCPYLPSRIHVTGVGSSLKAECDRATAIIGQSGSASNEVVVAGGASAEFYELSIGRGGSNSRLYVGVDSSVVVRRSGNNQRHVYMGYDGNSSQSSLIVDGGTFTAGGDFYCGYTNSANNAVRVINNGRLVVSNMLYTAKASNETSHDNEIEVSSGGVLSTSGFRGWGESQRLVISNGTFEVSGSQAPHIPSWGERDTIAVSLSGRSPKLKLGASGGFGADKESVSFRNANLHFVIPADGYAEAPIEAVSGRILVANMNKTSFSFDVSALSFEGRMQMNVPLMKTNGESFIDVTEEQANAWIAAAPTLDNGTRKCKIVFEKNGVRHTTYVEDPQAVYLRVPSNRGLFIVVH